jgi:hypothetical protein
VTLRDGEAHVPDHVGRFMIEKGYVAQGSEPNTKPEFERVAGGGHGALIPMFSRWCEGRLRRNLIWRKPNDSTY